MTGAARAAALSSGAQGARRGLALALVIAAGCAPKSGAEWVHDGSSEPQIARGGEGWIDPRRPADAGRVTAAALGARGASAAGERRAEDAAARERRAEDAAAGQDEPPLLVREHGRPARPAAAAQDLAAGLFRNTYYDFPREGGEPKDAVLYDAACTPIARVPRLFHDQVCVQGSGRLASGETVSFARRDCACADVCPRTGQKVCFDRLDPGRFPYGRGAMGRPITPLRTVAVDSSVIPLGTPVFVPDLVGLPLPGGGRHDGCFIAEDRGIKVVGRQIDVFTGDPALTERLNAIFPSNRGVRVVLHDARCRALGGPAGPS